MPHDLLWTGHKMVFHLCWNSQNTWGLLHENLQQDSCQPRENWHLFTLGLQCKIVAGFHLVYSHPEINFNATDPWRGKRFCCILHWLVASQKLYSITNCKNSRREEKSKQTKQQLLVHKLSIDLMCDLAEISGYVSIFTGVWLLLHEDEDWHCM